jgi:hypothetical protein
MGSASGVGMCIISAKETSMTEIERLTELTVKTRFSYQELEFVFTICKLYDITIEWFEKFLLSSGAATPFLVIKMLQCMGDGREEEALLLRRFVWSE